MHLFEILSRIIFSRGIAGNFKSIDTLRVFAGFPAKITSGSLRYKSYLLHVGDDCVGINYMRECDLNNAYEYSSIFFSDEFAHLHPFKL